MFLLFILSDKTFKWGLPVSGGMGADIKFIGILI